MLEIFKQPYIREAQIGTAVSRLGRIVEIQKVLIGQLDVLETMSPVRVLRGRAVARFHKHEHVQMSFLDFRDFLFPASGFQSVQFRLIENKLGLGAGQRMNYGSRGYCTYLEESDAEQVQEAESAHSLFDLVQAWLERTPAMAAKDFDFWSHYRGAVQDMFDNDEASIKANTDLPAAAQEAQVAELASQREHFATLFDAEKHAALVKRGDRRMSHKATQGALLIWMYQEEPLLQQPHRLLSLLLDVDEHLVRWRYRHAQMVHRMLGIKIGTGGSSGYSYLRATANKHKIFGDLFNLSTFLIPRHALPPLPQSIASLMRFSIEPSGAQAASSAASAVPAAAAE